MIFAGVIRIRHGGSEESIDAVRRQSPLSQSASVDDQADPKHAIFFHQERRPATPLWAVLPAKSLVSSGCCLCSASFDGGTASSLEAPIDSTLPRIPRRRGFHDVVQCFLSRLFSHCRHPYPTSRCNQTKPDGRFRHHVPIQRDPGVVGIQSMREELGHGLHRKEVRVHQL